MVGFLWGSGGSLGEGCCDIEVRLPGVWCDEGAALVHLPLQLVGLRLELVSKRFGNLARLRKLYIVLNYQGLRVDGEDDGKSEGDGEDCGGGDA